jgi:predicted protein tyrosine phosphatase
LTQDKPFSAVRFADSPLTVFPLPTVICVLRHRLSAWTLRRRHDLALRKVRVIESLDLPDDLKQAAVNRVLRRFELSLDRFTRNS